jgi:general transcription factor 3C polypeptide 1
MAVLNRNRKFRKALMRLCNMFSVRYAKHLEKTQNRSLKKDDCGLLVQSSSVEGLEENFSNVDGCTQETGLEEKPWYDIDDKSIKTALDEVIWYKRMAKLEAINGVGSSNVMPPTFSFSFIYLTC